VEIVDFCDAGDAGPERTGLDKPIAELTIEADQRDADGKSRTMVQGLKVGRQADIGGKTVHVALARPGQKEPRVVLVGAEGLASISTEPSGYVSRKSIQAAAADTGGLTVTRPDGPKRRFERSLDGWSVIDDAGTRTPATKADSESIEAVLTLLTQAPADRVALGQSWPQAWGGDSTGQPFASVELTSAGGSPVGAVELFTAKGANSSEQVVIRAGGTWRSYGGGTLSAIIGWLRRG